MAKTLNKFTSIIRFAGITGRVFQFVESYLFFISDYIGPPRLRGVYLSWVPCTRSKSSIGTIERKRALQVVSLVG